MNDKEKTMSRKKDSSGENNGSHLYIIAGILLFFSPDSEKDDGKIAELLKSLPK